MAFNGQVPITSKIVTDNIILKHINMFASLKHKISYEEENYVT